jgi:cytochrome b subunit of formate dehydrogenase
MNTGTVSYSIQILIREYIIFLKTYEGYNGYWISGTIRVRVLGTGTGTWAKMEKINQERLVVFVL